MPASRKRGIDALGLLNAYAFINSQDTGINLHRLVHISMRNWLRQNALFSHWIQRAADQMRNVFPDDPYTNRGLWRECLPHALSLVYEDEFTAQWKDYVDLIDNIADCLYEEGKFNEAEVLYTELLRIKQENTGPNHPSALYSMAQLAVTYWKQGRWNEAEKLGVQVLEMRKTVLGAEHPHTLTSMSNLALVYTDQGRWNEAEKLGVQVLEMRKTVLGAKHPDTLTSMSNLALTYRKQGRWNEAEKLWVQVTEMRKTVLGAEHPDTLLSMHNLAYTWQSQGKLQDALALMEKCFELRNKILGPNHPDAISSSRFLGVWKDIHDYYQMKDARLAAIQIEGSQHLETGTGHTAAAFISQRPCEERFKSPHTQRWFAAKPFLGGPPLLMASRRIQHSGEDKTCKK